MREKSDPVQALGIRWLIAAVARAQREDLVERLSPTARTLRTTGATPSISAKTVHRMRNQRAFAHSRL